MSPAVQRRNAISLLAYYGPLALVGLAFGYQLYRLSRRVHSVEQRVEDWIVDAETDNAAHAIHTAVEAYSAIPENRLQLIQLVSRNRAGEG